MHLIIQQKSYNVNIKNSTCKKKRNFAGLFFEAFDTALRAAGKSTYYKTTRMADGMLSVSSSRAYLGKIKLQGRKTRMQYEKRGGNFTALEGGTLEQYIDLLSYWVRTA